MIELFTGSMLIAFIALCMRDRKPQQMHYTSGEQLDNMTQQKKLLITRIRGMKYTEEARYYQFEIADFVNSFLFHDDIARAKEDLKNELQAQVNYLSVPQLMKTY
jgi:hypothetical protein